MLFDLANANFLIKLNSLEDIPVDIMKNFIDGISSTLKADTEGTAFYFLTQLLRCEARETDYDTVYAYMNAQMKKGFAIIGRETDETNEKIITDYLTVKQLAKSSVNFVDNGILYEKVKKYVDEFETYAQNESDLIFYCVYAMCGKLLTMAFSDFNKNVKFITLVAGYLNKYAEKEEAIDFIGKNVI